LHKAFQIMSGVPIFYDYRQVLASPLDLAVWIKRTLDVLELDPLVEGPEWEKRVHELRLAAVWSDYILDFDWPEVNGPLWPKAAITTLVEAGDEATGRLAARASIPWEELSTWRVLGTPITQGIEPFHAKLTMSGPVWVGLGISSLLKGMLPPEPEGHSWCFGYGDNVPVSSGKVHDRDPSSSPQKAGRTFA
jgi:hypothetical protein